MPGFSGTEASQAPRYDFAKFSEKEPGEPGGLRFVSVSAARGVPAMGQVGFRELRRSRELAQLTSPSSGTSATSAACLQPMPTNQKGRESAEFARRGASWHLRGCGSLRSRTCSKPGLLSCKMRLEGARSEVRVRDASSRPAAPARERPSATFGRRASSAEAPPRAPMAEPWLWPLRPLRFGFEESRFPWRRPSASTHHPDWFLVHVAPFRDGSSGQERLGSA